LGQNFIKCERDQSFLLPPRLADLIPDNDPVWFVEQAVRDMDLAPFKLRYRLDGRGRAAFDPEMMVSLLVYAYMMGERSTRRMENLCLRDAAFRYLCGARVPDHSTISRFRKDNSANLEHLFDEILGVSAALGMVSTAFAAVDGTKIQANASIDRNRPLEDFKRWLRECDELDAAEDELYGPDKRGDEQPEWLNTPEKMTEAVRREMERRRAEAEAAEARQREKLRRRAEREKKTGKKTTGPKPKSPEEVRSEMEGKRVNLTDPESRMMKGARGFVQGYNAQVAVTEDQLIVAAELSQQESDWNLLHPIVRQARANIARSGVKGCLRTVAADAGYDSVDNLKKAKSLTPDFFIATRKDRLLAKELKRTPITKGEPPEESSEQAKMEHKLKTRSGRETYAKRGRTVEPVFGQMKDWLGFGRFQMRGFEVCSGEWQLMCAASNMWKIFRFKARMQAAAT